VSERLRQNALIRSTSAFLDERLKDRAFSKVHIVLVATDWIDEGTSQDLGVPPTGQPSLGRIDIPVGEICVGSKTGGIPICPYQLSLDGLSRSPTGGKD